MLDHVFSPLKVGGLELKNRLTMAPLYLGYAGEGGTVSPLLLEHYRLMAGSGVALVVVENATIDHPVGSGSNRTLRADTDGSLDGLARLARAIKEEGALACLQINHAGRFAGMASQPLAPSAVEAFGRTPKPLTPDEIQYLVGKYADAARRVMEAGFDMVELHGGTGYLLAQFISPRTNRRNDVYGGSVQNRCRFPVEVLGAVQAAVRDFPVGYRFLASEWLEGGLEIDEACEAAKILEGAGVAYLSVMGGTYESFFLPHVVERCKQQGYMVDLASAVKRAVSVPVIAAGRIASGKLAESIIADGKADLIGLARVLWADPDWPSKVREGREEEIVHCDPDGDDTCTKLVMKGKPAFCVRWPHEKLQAWKARFE